MTAVHAPVSWIEVTFRHGLHCPAPAAGGLPGSQRDRHGHGRSVNARDGRWSEPCVDGDACPGWSLPYKHGDARLRSSSRHHVRARRTNRGGRSGLFRYCALEVAYRRLRPRLLCAGCLQLPMRTVGAGRAASLPAVNGSFESRLRGRDFGFGPCHAPASEPDSTSDRLSTLAYFAPFAVHVFPPCRACLACKAVT